MIFTYCPQCRAELDHSGRYPKCVGCQVTYYSNAKPTTATYPVRDGMVLVTKRAIDPFKGTYDAIGGFLEEDDHPLDGARREALEETGLIIEPIELLGHYIDQYEENGSKKYTLNISYIGQIVGGEMRARDDAASLHWIPIKDFEQGEGFTNFKQAMADLKKRFV